MKSLEHIEIEHKFVVPVHFNRAAFRRKMTELGCLRRTKVDVCDTYYVSSSFPNKIFRHRLDKELQHLTVKARGIASDARLEVNLKLAAGDQSSAIKAFVNTFGKFRSVLVKKKVEAYYFPECEIVYYTAKSGRRSISCVEFEATKKTSLHAARKILMIYESKAGFFKKKAENKSLFEMLVLPQLLPKSI